MRMSMRQFTRLTNGFSKKLENHEQALALYVLQLLPDSSDGARDASATEAGTTDHVWSLYEVIGLL